MTIEDLREWIKDNPFWDAGWYQMCKYHNDPNFFQWKTEYNHNYYQEKRNEILIQKKQYYQKHKEARKKYQREYYRLKKIGVTPKQDRINKGIENINKNTHYNSH